MVVYALNVSYTVCNNFRSSPDDYHSQPFTKNCGPGIVSAARDAGPTTGNTPSAAFPVLDAESRRFDGMVSPQLLENGCQW